HSVIRGHKPAPERCRRHCIHIVGQRHHVHIGVGNTGVFAVAAVMMHAREAEGLADIAAPSRTKLAFSAGQMKGNGDSVAPLESLAVTTDLLDGSAKLVAKNPRELQPNIEPRPFLLPQMPIASADAACLNADHRIGRAWRWRGDFANLERLAVFSQYCG